MYDFVGVMVAVESVIKELKSKSKMVTTPEEIAQVYFILFFLI